MLKFAYTNCVFSNTFKSNLIIIIKRRINVFRDCDEYKNTRPELVKVMLNRNSFRSPQNFREKRFLSCGSVVQEVRCRHSNVANCLKLVESQKKSDSLGTRGTRAGSTFISTTQIHRGRAVCRKCGANII